MNKFSGYAEFTLLSGRIVKLKFGNGATELYAKMMGFKTVSEVNKSLTVDPIIEEGEDGKPTYRYDLPIDMLVSVRRMVFCAAQYVAMREGTPIDFDEWDAAEWAEEIGFDTIFGNMDQPPASEEVDSKKKGNNKAKKPLIRPTQ